MTTAGATSLRDPGFLELYTPKLVTVLREGYGIANLRADLIAGLTVAVVALPLSMAIAIASGATPAQGLYTAIIGGFLVSALSGSRFQVGGPAGAFIVLVAATVMEDGIDGLILATLLSGVMITAAGLLRLGTYVKFIPYPVTVGFTAGIAVIILASQITDMFGLTLAGEEPGPFLDKLPVLWAALPTVDPLTVIISVASIAVIVGLRKVRPHWPGMLIAVAGAALVTGLANLPVETIGTRFGGIPTGMPMPSLPALDAGKVAAVLPNAIAFALLGTIESLLSAVVADGMTGRRHRSNCELVGQGIANIGSSLFGGFCVTGTIARTATNIRAGAHSPISGMVHALTLLVFVLVAAPLASFIPLASLAGVLVVVAWNMVEKHAFAMLLRVSRGDAVVLLATLGLTVFRDLISAIVVGFALGSVLFIHRMSRATAVESHDGHMPLVGEDQADAAEGRKPYEESHATDRDIVVYRISGALFFGAAASVGMVLDRVAIDHRALILDFEAVPLVDSTAANTIEGLARKAGRHGVVLYLSGASEEVRRALVAQGLKPPLVHYAPGIEQAVGEARARIAAAGSDKGAAPGDDISAGA